MPATASEGEGFADTRLIVNAMSVTGSRCLCWTTVSEPRWGTVIEAFASRVKA